VFTVPAPFGGPLVLQSLNTLERYQLGQISDPVLRTHLMLEAWKFAYANRMGLADPQFVSNVSLLQQQMIDKDHAAAIRTKISLSGALPLSHYEDLVPLLLQSNNAGTSHMCAVAGSDVIALTSTINLTFGSQFLSTSTGVLLNDEMDDFSVPGNSNAFDYPPSEVNFPAAGKRPLSSMCPVVITRDTGLYFTVGGSGGSKIPTGVMQTLLNVLELNMDVQQAINEPRIHTQLLPDDVVYEREYPSAVISGLKTRMQQRNLTPTGKLNAVQAATKNADGSVSAASDPRKYGRAAVY